MLIWFLQIFFVNNYYMDMKIRQTEENAQSMLALLENGDMEAFQRAATNITSDNDVYVRYELNGVPIFPLADSDTYKEEIAAAKKKLKSDKNDGQYAAIISNEDELARTYVFAANLDGEDSAGQFFVISPLYPVRSTVEILHDQLFLIIAIALFLAFVLSYYVSNRISRPIQKLTASASRMADGDFSTRFIPGKRNYTEINDLSRALNKSAIELGKTADLQKDIMANVSHDLRTPLTMIKSYAEMIRDLSGDNPVTRNEHLQVIIDESDRLAVLVNDMMALSQMQAGTMQLKIDTFDITETTETLLNPYRLLEADGYSFDLHSREHYNVIGDEDRIKQVISNLLTNAIKYCGTDKKIIINIRRWGNKIHFEIIDHGVGIKPEELDHMWERYYKSSSNHVRSTGGSGLGLSIVSQILNLHGAKYGAESKVGKGTTMWFELPYADFGQDDPRPDQRYATRLSHLLSEQARNVSAGQNGGSGQNNFGRNGSSGQNNSGRGTRNDWV